MPKFRIRAGTWDASDMTDTYDVENFPVQTDQRNYPWFIVTPSELFRELDATTEGGLDGTIRKIGNWNGSLYFAALTPLMSDYVQATIFPTDGTNEVLTIAIYNAKRGWVCLNGNGHFLEPVDFGESRPRGQFLKAVRLIDFDEGVEADSGGDFNSDFNSDFNLGGIPA